MSYTHYLTAKKEKDYTEVVTLPVTENNSLFQDKLADYSFIEMHISHLMGDVMTLIDATITDKDQKKAVKDIIRKHWSDTYANLCDALADADKLKELTEVDEAEVSNMEQVTLEQALGA